MQREHIRSWLNHSNGCSLRLKMDGLRSTGCDESEPDVILLDLMMPEMDGFQLVAEIQKHPAWRRIPVIVLTARDLTAEDRDAIEFRN